MIVAKRGYRINPNWELERNDNEPDVVCDFVAVPEDYYIDDAFDGGLERDFDISLQLKLKGYELKVVGADSEYPEPEGMQKKLLWKWGAYFDWKFSTRDKDYLRDMPAFDGRIALDSPFNIADGYGNMGVNLLLTMLENGLEVYTSANWKEQNNLDDAPVVISHIAQRGFGNCNYGMRLSQPDTAFSCPSKFKINWSMWEFPIMPEKWVPGANDVDLCFVPCGWNKQLWLEAGVTTPIIVIPLGFNPRIYWPRERAKAKPFRFYTDGSILGNSKLIETWKNSLAGREDVELVVKFPYSVKEKSTDNLRVLDKRVPVETMRQLYWDADCYLYPTQAEGFGLFPLEAMATGLPVIATRLETMFGFINPKISYPIPFRDVEWFHNPDNELFTDELLRVANGKWDYIGDKGLLAAEHAFGYWKWLDTLEKIVGVLGND